MEQHQVVPSEPVPSEPVPSELVPSEPVPSEPVVPSTPEPEHAAQTAGRPAQAASLQVGLDAG